MKLNYRSRWTWLSIFVVLMMLCYFFVGSVSTLMGFFGFGVGYAMSKIGRSA